MLSRVDMHIRTQLCGTRVKPHGRQAVREELHATVRNTVVDWLQSQDHAPDIKIYVTGHSMGGALAAHCALDLKAGVGSAMWYRMPYACLHGAARNISMQCCCNTIRHGVTLAGIASMLGGFAGASMAHGDARFNSPSRSNRVIFHSLDCLLFRAIFHGEILCRDSGRPPPAATD